VGDGADGTGEFAGGAVDASVGVDVVLGGVVGGVDAIDGADVDAGGVFDADAGFGDDVGHGSARLLVGEGVGLDARFLDDDVSEDASLAGEAEAGVFDRA